MKFGFSGWGTEESFIQAFLSDCFLRPQLEVPCLNRSKNRLNVSLKKLEKALGGFLKIELSGWGTEEPFIQAFCLDCFLRPRKKAWIKTRTHVIITDSIHFKWLILLTLCIIFHFSLLFFRISDEKNYSGCWCPT